MRRLALPWPPGRRPVTGRDPFADLGLAAAAGLSDDEIRAAWRRIAAATHPDRPDGGNPARYAAAAAAYTELRTRYGRGEALARRADGQIAAGSHAAPERDAAWIATGRALTRLPGRIARGRPVRLALRCAAAATAGWLAVTAAAQYGAGPALTVGAVTWLVLTGRRDLAP